MFLEVDRGLRGETLKDYTRDVKGFLAKYGLTFDRSLVRRYLAPLTDNRRRKVLAALKQLYRFIDRPEVVEGFKTPRSKSRIVKVPNKKELRHFYEALPDIKHKTAFLMLASSGLRLSELLNLTFEDVNFERQMLTPNCHEGATKHSYITFYNQEAKQILACNLEEHGIRDEQLFSLVKRTLQNTWNQISKKVGVKITPQLLRKWFCSEMLRLGVQEVYIDAFQGRVPKSVLARHYTDYSQEKLKEIYEKAGLKVLS